MSNTFIAMIQSGLKGLGFDAGTADGLYGRKTEGAAKDWLAAGGRPAGAIRRPETSSLIRQAGLYPVDEVIVHCSATRPDWMDGESPDAKRAEIRRWHLARGFADIGYHWLITRSGSVIAGRPEQVMGAHVEGQNQGTIGICLIGGHGSDATDKFSDHFTAQQDITLRQLLQGIGMRTAIKRISGHNEYAARACPGFNVTTWLKGAA